MSAEVIVESRDQLAGANDETLLSAKIAMAVQNARVAELNASLPEEQWPRIDLSRMGSMTSLRRVTSDREVKKLVNFVSENGNLSNVRVGFNMGSGLLSLCASMEDGDVFSPDGSNVVREMLGFGVESSRRNLLLQKMFKDCHVGLVERKINWRLGHVTFVFDSARAQTMELKSGSFYTDSRRDLYEYTPFYERVCGYDRDAQLMGDEVELLQRAAFTKQFVDRFWSRVREQQYYADAELKRAVTDYLTRTFVPSYFESRGGVRASGAASSSAAALGENSALMWFYLHGMAGIGKSQFVKVFTRTLRAMIDESLAVGQRCEVVRLPLNAMTPANFKRILLVHGISDYSIERILEQTVCRGGIAVVHLEEMPECKQLQRSLFALVLQLLDSILGRYPEYRANLIIVTTSNYELDETLCAYFGNRLLHVRPLDETGQRQWCRQVIGDALRSAPNNDDDGDRQCHSEAAVAKVLDAIPMPPFSVDMRPLELWKLSLRFFLQLGVPMSQLDVHNDYFYHRDGAEPLDTIVDMCQHRYLKPAVIVAYDERHIEPIVERVERATAERGGRIHRLNVSAIDDSDKIELFGDPSSPSLGGIPRHIDQVTNPVYKRDRDIAVVVAHASELGQFMLRELLETNTSRTHRTRILKQRTVFIVRLFEGSLISPQLTSRSHLILH
jgi:hypothetical protein